MSESKLAVNPVRDEHPLSKGEGVNILPLQRLRGGEQWRGGDLRATTLVSVFGLLLPYLGRTGVAYRHVSREPYPPPNQGPEVCLSF